MPKKLMRDFLGTMRFDPGHYISPGKRRKILARGLCAHCMKSKYDGVRFTVDHIIPRSYGGSDDESNLQCLCNKCNSKKGHRYIG